MFFVPAIFYPLLLFTTKVINVAAFLQEEAYVEFLCIRRVPLEERTCADDTHDVIPQVSTIVS